MSTAHSLSQRRPCGLNRETKKVSSLGSSRGIGRSSRHSQDQTLLGTTPSIWPRYSRDRPRTCRKWRASSSSSRGAGLGSWLRNRTIPGSAQKLGEAVPASQLKTVATSITLDAAALWHLMAGRGAQEKTIAELKDGFAFDTIPTKRYAANSAWQWLSVLAHNLHRSFQLSVTEEKRRRSPKRTFLYRLDSIKSSRFEWLNTAGRLLRLSSGLTLRLPQSSALEKGFQAWPQSA